MRILLSPQVPVNLSDRILYTFEDDVFTAEINGIKETFDFSGLPDGVLDMESVEVDLNPNPLISARKEDGVLYVELLNYIGLDATEEEKFPKWIDHTEYKPPKEDEEVEDEPVVENE